MNLLRLLERQANGKRRAIAYFALHGNGAVVTPHYAGHDARSQAGAAGFCGNGFIGEETLSHVFRHTATGVANLHRQRVFARLRRLRAQRDRAACRRLGNRVVDQVILRVIHLLAVELDARQSFV